MFSLMALTNEIPPKNIQLKLWMHLYCRVYVDVNDLGS